MRGMNGLLINEFNDGERLLGEHPLFFHKKTGIIRRMVFDVPDLERLKSAKKIQLLQALP